MSVGALLLCAGRGERLGAGVSKALAPLAGRPLFTWSLETLQRSSAIEGIVVVGPVRQAQDLLAASGIEPAKIVGWSEGGRERQQSVARGLAALPERFTTVAIHDCARALVSGDLVARVVGDALRFGAAIAAVPLEDTLKRGTLDTIETTVPRQGLYRAQTPQAFRRDWLTAAHASARTAATDDSALVEALGHPVHLTPGDPLNLKITTPLDLELAEAWLSAHPVRP
ncbi:MAG: 2-C-methyl-D-erythritol 4-phosphate cytidylyltransferase [Candidatus Eisenbacteria bacterium RBG_16_71_46]|nr:MAG: 2-C-methyl-D-erythritol 4-phosphate cytidylyltransferase [Candidatus Eisenbacteria bacterium RBG_16_71_46]OGF20959.1 MAG: 2-C-methyl-D-erythritol 4-phosphate cytidylyltransferase [Candidatus Eisenbacteria bacterium RBG_19FT_COMBO_70_11]